MTGKVKKIIEEVKNDGDKAVRKYTEIFDGVKLASFKVSRRETKEAYGIVNKDASRSLREAARNIKDFAKAQKRQFQDLEYTKNGVTVGQKIIPIERIGVYVPGGNYPLPSTALMCVIPARVAGVREIIVCSPKIKPITIVAANLAGADAIFNIGGIQAIAAMAYGTKTIPKVDKIVGPGNIYVTSAKKEIFGDCGIDLLAGPTEILLIADKYANPRFVAADLLAQAEHDIEAKVILISDSQALLKSTKKELKIQLGDLGTRAIIKQALKNKKIILVKNLKEAIEIANKMAPEHLSLQVKNPRKYLNKLRNYGSLFLGPYSAVAFGDYCSGPNHVLPTSKTARYTGGLSVKDFLKTLTYQQITKKGVKKLSKTVIELASVEGLDAHKKSVEIRKNGKGH